MTGLVDRIVEAHGGAERWRRTTEVELHLSSGGPAFAAKGRRSTLHGVTATVATDGQRVELRGSTPHPWHLRFDGADTIGLPGLHRGRRRLAWSVADLGAFAAAALWTYVHVPFVLTGRSVEVELVAPWREAGETWQRVAVTFPPSVATHCRQVLYVDENHRLRRHDYTARLRPVGQGRAVPVGLQGVRRPLVPHPPPRPPPPSRRPAGSVAAAGVDRRPPRHLPLTHRRDRSRLKGELGAAPAREFP